MLRKHCFLPMFRHVSKSEQTLGNISEKHRETSNVSEFPRKHFCFSGSKFCFRNNVSAGGQTGKRLRKHRESLMFPQQCFLVYPGLKLWFRDQTWLEYGGALATGDSIMFELHNYSAHSPLGLFSDRLHQVLRLLKLLT